MPRSSVLRRSCICPTLQEVRKARKSGQRSEFTKSSKMFAKLQDQQVLSGCLLLLACSVVLVGCSMFIRLTDAEVSVLRWSACTRPGGRCSSQGPWRQAGRAASRCSTRSSSQAVTAAEACLAVCKLRVCCSLMLLQSPASVNLLQCGPAVTYRVADNEAEHLGTSKVDNTSQSTAGIHGAAGQHASPRQRTPAWSLDPDISISTLMCYEPACAVTRLQLCTSEAHTGHTLLASRQHSRFETLVQPELHWMPKQPAWC